jgi:hypothetical protein
MLTNELNCVAIGLSGIFGLVGMRQWLKPLVLMTFIWISGTAHNFLIVFGPEVTLVDYCEPGFCAWIKHEVPRISSV